MPTIEELLARTELTNDIKITLPNIGEVTVGDLRNYVASTKDTAARAAREAEDRKKAAEARLAEANKLADDALALSRMYEGKEPPKPEPKSGEIDWDTDPVYSPVGKRLAALEKMINDDVKAGLANQKKAIAAGMQFIVDQYYKQRWNAIPEKDRPKDKTYKDYTKVAAEQNIKDEYGLDDPIGAWSRETEVARRAAEVEEARKKGIEEGKKLAAAATLPRPGSGPRVPLPNEKPQYKDMNEAFAAAAQDPDILRIANGDFTQ
jgi:hypothetical protein